MQLELNQGKQSYPICKHSVNLLWIFRQEIIFVLRTCLILMRCTWGCTDTTSEAPGLKLVTTGLFCIWTKIEPCGLSSENYHIFIFWKKPAWTSGSWMRLISGWKILLTNRESRAQKNNKNSWDNCGKLQLSQSLRSFTPVPAFWFEIFPPN